MVAVSEPFYGVSIIVEGMMQGMGNTMIPFVCNIVGMWAIRIVGTFICIYCFGMGLISAWACMIGHNLLLFGCLTLYSRSFVFALALIVLLSLEFELRLIDLQ